MMTTSTTRLGRRLTILVACVAAWAGVMVPVQAAFANETIAGDLWAGNSLFTMDDVDTLTECAKFSPDQVAMATELLKGVRLKLRGVQKRWQRGWEDLYTSEMEDDDDGSKLRDNYKTLAQRMLDEQKALEVQFMEDLKSLLTEEQIDGGWAEFERARRRLLLRDDSPPARADMLGMLRAARVTNEQRAALGEILTPYFQQLDSLIIERRPLQRQVTWSPLRWLRDSEPSDEDQKRFADLSGRIGQLHIRTARLIENELPEEQKKAFQQQRLRMEWGDNYPDFVGWVRMQEVLRIRSLSDDQRTSIRQLVQAAEEKLFPIAIARKAQWDERVLMGTRRDDDDDDETDTDYRKKVFRARKQLLDDVLAVLTTSQREHYDNGVSGSTKDEDKILARRRYGDRNWWGDELSEADREE